MVAIKLRNPSLI